MNKKANKGSLPKIIDYNCEVLINVDDSPTGHLLGNHGDTCEEKTEDNGLVETLDSSKVSLPQETVNLTHEHKTLMFCTKENIKRTRSGDLYINLFTTNACKALKDHPKLSITTDIKLGLDVRHLSKQNLHETLRLSDGAATSDFSDKHQCMTVNEGTRGVLSEKGACISLSSSYQCKSTYPHTN